MLTVRWIPSKTKIIFYEKVGLRFSGEGLIGVVEEQDWNGDKETLDFRLLLVNGAELRFGAHRSELRLISWSDAR